MHIDAWLLSDIAASLISQGTFNTHPFSTFITNYLGLNSYPNHPSNSDRLIPHPIYWLTIPQIYAMYDRQKNILIYLIIICVLSEVTSLILVFRRDLTSKQSLSTDPHSLNGVFISCSRSNADSPSPSPQESGMWRVCCREYRPSNRTFLAPWIGMGKHIILYERIQSVWSL